MLYDMYSSKFDMRLFSLCNRPTSQTEILKARIGLGLKSLQTIICTKTQESFNNCRAYVNVLPHKTVTFYGTKVSKFDKSNNIYNLQKIILNCTTGYFLRQFWAKYGVPLLYQRRTCHYGTS